jgi:DNA-binding NarL/FixJ family response regulator
MDSAAVLHRSEGEALATTADGGDPAMKVLIVDDHALFREGLVLLLEALQQNVQALQAEDAASALAQIAAHPDLDVVLLDLVMPGPGGIDLLQEIKRASPAVPVVILSAEEQVSIVTDAIEKGASGFIPKTSTGEIMRGALRLVMGGGIYIPPIVLRDETRPVATAPGAGAPARPEEIGISPRQVAVLDCLLVGMPTKVIASRLGISENTVKTHIMAIFRALKVRNRTEAVLEASRYGFKVGQPWRRRPGL